MPSPASACQTKTARTVRLQMLEETPRRVVVADKHQAGDSGFRFEHDA